MNRLGQLAARFRRTVREYERTNAGITATAERLWFGLSSREEVLALEMIPERRTGKPRAGAPLLALKLLDTVTCPMLTREKRELPPSQSSYCWSPDGWTVDELLEFFSWFDTPDLDLYDLDDETAGRYREQLETTERAWAGDRIVVAWLQQRTTSHEESLELLQDPTCRNEILSELEVAAASLNFDL